MIRTRHVGIFFFIIALALGGTALAQESKKIASPGTIQDRFLLSFGFFLPDYNTDARISSPDHEGSGVDLEKDLGFNAHDSVFRFDGLFRISNRHEIGFSWFDLNRDSSKTIEKDIDWDEYHFTVGVTLRGRFDLHLYKIRYRYMVLQGPRLEFGVGGGISYMGFDFGLSGRASITDGEQEKSVEAAWSRSPGLPVPAIGGGVRWAILGNLFLGGDIEYIRGSYDHQEARYSYVLFSLNWFPWRHVGFGLMYNVFKVTYQDHGKHFTGRFDYSYSGPVMAVNVIF